MGGDKWLFAFQKLKQQPIEHLHIFGRYKEACVVHFGKFGIAHPRDKGFGLRVRHQFVEHATDIKNRYGDPSGRLYKLFRHCSGIELVKQPDIPFGLITGKQTAAQLVSHRL